MEAMGWCHGFEQRQECFVRLSDLAGTGEFVTKKTDPPRESAMLTDQDLAELVDYADALESDSGSGTSGTQCSRCASTTLSRQGFSWQQDLAAWQCFQQRSCLRKTC